MDVAMGLDRALRAAAVPIVGVRIGRLDDRATWAVEYLPAATAPERATGEALRLSFDPLSQAAIDAEAAARAVSQAALKERLADLALLASVTDPGWAAATVPQKIAKVRALAVTWQALRSFVEKNL